MKIAIKKQLHQKTGRPKLKTNKSIASRIINLKKVKNFNADGKFIGYELKAKIRKNAVGTLMRSKSKRAKSLSKRTHAASKCILKHIKKYNGTMKRFI